MPDAKPLAVEPTAEIAQTNGDAGVQSSSPAELSPAASAVGGGTAAVLWLSLLTATVVVGSVAALLAWVLSIEFTGLVGAGWTLARKPSFFTFNAGFSIASYMGSLGLLVAFLGAWFAPTAGPRWPTRVLLLVAAWAAVAGLGGAWLRTQQEIDLGQVEASGVLLPILTAFVAAPLYTFWQAQRFARWLWRSTRTRGVLAGVVIGVSIATSAGVVLSFATENAPSATEAQLGEGQAVPRLLETLEHSDRLSAAEIVHQWLQGVGTQDGRAGRLGSSQLSAPNAAVAPGLVGIPNPEPLANCVDALSKPKEGSYLGQGVRYLVSHRMGNGDAEDLAWETVLRVCLRHASTPVSDLRTYYFGALQNRRISHFRSPRSRWCEMRREVSYSYDTELGLADTALDVEKAFCTLPETERRVVKARIAGEDDEEIASSLGSNPAAVRQAASRGFRKLRAAAGVGR